MPNGDRSLNLENVISIVEVFYPASLLENIVSFIFYALQLTWNEKKNKVLTKVYLND